MNIRTLSVCIVCIVCVYTCLYNLCLLHRYLDDTEVTGGSVTFASDVTTNTYTKESVTPADGGVYACKILENNTPILTSESFTLSVTGNLSMVTDIRILLYFSEPAPAAYFR